MKDILLYENVPPQENNFTVKFRIYKAHPELIPHWHEHIELLFFLRGGCRVTVGGGGFPAEEGDLVFVNPTEVHSFTGDEDNEYFCILIYPAFFSDVRFSDVQISNLIKCDEYVKRCFIDMCTEYEHAAPGADMMLKSHAYRLMAYLLRSYTAEKPTEKEQRLHSRTLERLNRITEYVANNYQKKITTAELSKMCYLSEGHFCRFFKTATGRSAIDYINEYRIERAAILLINTDESVTEIAERVGFDDGNYFSRTFKKIKKMSPQDYRKGVIKHE